MEMDAAFYREMVECLHEGVYTMDRDRRILYWNKAAEEIAGYSAAEVVGTRCADNVLEHVDENGTELCKGLCPAERAMQTGAGQEARVFLKHKLGQRVPVRVRAAPMRNARGEVIGAVEIFSEDSMSMLLEQRMKELERLAMLDELTRLPNRRYLETAIESRLGERERYSWPFGVLMMDLDRLKAVNDTWGHPVGDQALRMTANTLHNSSRPYDVVGRWGGDEFLAVIGNVDADGLRRIGERCRALVERSALTRRSGVIRVTISVGGAIAAPQETGDSLVRRADAMLLLAKDSGRNQVQLTEER